LSIWLLAITVILLVAVLYLPFETVRTVIDVRLRDFIVLYLGLYTIILVLGRFTKMPTLAGWLVLGLAAVEVSQFGRITAANRETVQKQDLIHGVAARTEPVEMLQD